MTPGNPPSQALLSVISPCVLIAGASACLAAAFGAPAAGPHGDTEWVKWVVVNVCPARVYSRAWRSDAIRRKLLRDFDPDVADWWSGVILNRGGWLTRRGVASSSPTAYEYQEAIGPMWGFATSLFRDNGAARRENGGWARFPKNKYGGAHMMCLHAPKWRGVVAQGFLRAAACGDSVTQDNIGCPVTKYHPGFCSWCNRGFIEYLEHRFSPPKLRALGVGDLEQFHIRAYLAARRRRLHWPMWKPPPKGVSPDALIEDPLLREYIRFQYQSMIAVWEQLAVRAKREARRLGRAEPALYGNLAGCAGRTPLATALCSRVDVVWVEASRLRQPCFERLAVGSNQPRYREGVFLEGCRPTTARQAWSTLIYKAGRAAGRFRRPVWTLQYPEQWFGPHKRMPAAIVLAEAYANGGVPVMLFAPSVTKRADTESLTWQVCRETARFVRAHRALFIDRTRLADTALVLSLPSLFWRAFSSLSVRPMKHLQAFTAAARDLEERHAAYEVIVFGHPDLVGDSDMLARLTRYRRVVLPNVDCLSERQAAALRAFARRGGEIIASGECGSRDEDFRPRPRPALAGVHLTSRLPAREPPGKALVRTDAPPTVWLNLWRHAAGPMTSVQLVNYDIDLAADRPRPVGPFHLALRLRAAARLTSARLFRPGSKPLALPIRRRGAELSVTVPRLGLWAVVAFTAKDEWAARSAAASARKQLERLRIARRTPGAPAAACDALMREAEDRLAGIQGGEARVRDFAAQCAPLRRLAERLRARVEQITRDAEARLDAARRETLEIEAVEKFDFGGPIAPPGWTAVTADTAYTPGRGFGWLSRGPMTAVDDGAPDPLHRDYLRNRDPAEYLPRPRPGVGNRQFKTDYPPLSPATFRVDVPNGEYLVTVVSGCFEPPPGGSAAADGPAAATYVSADGRPRLLGAIVPVGRFLNRAFRVRVQRGHLILRFSGPNVGPFYHNTIEWLVNGVIIQRPGRRLTTRAAESLRTAERLRRAALREWEVFGPFPDPACAGLDAPGALPPPDSAGRRVRTGDAGDAPGLDLDALLGQSVETFAFARARVHCDRPTRAVLWLSASQTAAAFLNGVEVLRNETAAGLTLAGPHANVRLHRGWNIIVVKCPRSWRGPWRFWAGLTTPGGRPLTTPSPAPGKPP